MGAGGNHIDAAERPAYRSVGGGEVVVSGSKGIAVIQDYAVAATEVVQANEGHGDAGSSQDRRAALRCEVLATVEVAGAAGDRADPESEGRDCSQLGQRRAEASGSGGAGNGPRGLGAQQLL